MNFASQPRKPGTESIIPMINVVFLLLIFFLMTAQITPPDPIEVRPPEANSLMPKTADLTLYLDAGGQLAFRDVQGEAAVMAALDVARNEACETALCEDEMRPPLSLRADERVPAQVVAQLLPQLAAHGFGRVELITVAR